MKKSHLILILVALVMILGFLLSRKEGRSVVAPATALPLAPEGNSNAASKSVVQGRKAEDPPQPVRTVSTLKKLKDAYDGKQEWRTPIEFYGQVIDENNAPVPETTVDFGWTDLSINGFSKARTQSDGNGLFSLKGVTGKHLTVTVSKEGYYTSKLSNDSFTYAGENVNFVPNANKPEIFKLRKKGQAEALVEVSNRFKVSLNGTPIEINLLTGSVAPSGQGHLEIRCESDYKNKNDSGAFDWTLTLLTKGGGIVETTEEFPFKAPEIGYMKALEIKMTADQTTTWRNMIDRKYFVKLPDGKYGRLSLFFVSYNGVLRVQSLFNPSGSANLEYDSKIQQKAIKPE